MTHTQSNPETRQFCFDPEALHMDLMLRAPRRLGFSDGVDLERWSDELRAKLTELLRMPAHPGTSARPVMLGEAQDCGDYLRQRLVFTAEPGADVPCTLLLPKGKEGPLPVMICLQGHTTGAHISLGEAKYEGDENSLGGDRDFALQAVRRGFAALAMEQRAFGERHDHRPEDHRRTGDLARNDDNRTCKHPAMTALLLGRTLLGERVFDVIRACDAIEEISTLDAGRIYIMGQSGGGTVGWYASAVEPRLKASMLASFFGTVAGTIGAIDHCTDNYLPDMLTWLDFPDIAGAMRGTKILVVMGRLDPLFPHASVLEASDHVARIFKAQGREQDFALAVGEGGHRFYADLAWPKFLAMI
ncbi:alpha/beta hydrolase family protein [Martelella alba]|nr:alpha/beta hydrolase family protein [Martelella alba]